MAKIKVVYKNSPFYRKVRIGDELISINEKTVHDVLDYLFFSADDGPVTLTVRRNGKLMKFSEEITEGDLRLEFEEYLMDEHRSCKNKCVFCFIDQLPKGMRPTLYYKDDDFRLSLLCGNYVTLTNLSEEDVERILALKVSPLNVSVHTTEPELRVQMMQNPRAGELFPLLKRFAEAGINLRGQIVLCPELNDGAHLDRTMADLKTLFPAVSSVSVVPVGLTRYRKGLASLRSFTSAEAATVLEQIHRMGDQCRKELGTRLFYPSDEWYLKAGIPLPGYDFYEDFEQLENGVGMLISFAQEFNDVFRPMAKFTRPVRVSIATGQATDDFMNRIINTLKKKCSDLQCPVYPIRNDFFGPEITVTGLITGQDLIAQLRGKELGDALLLPSSMLREDRFLDDISVKDAERALGVKIRVTNGSAEDLIEIILKSARRC